MQDLSSLFDRDGGDPFTAMAPTAQAAGNQRDPGSGRRLRPPAGGQRRGHRERGPQG